MDAAAVGRFSDAPQGWPPLGPRLGAAVIAALALTAPAAAQLSDPDITDDGVVNVLDGSLVGSCQGLDPASVCVCRRADTDRDGDVDSDDLDYVAGAFGQSGFPVVPPDTTAPVLAVTSPAPGSAVTSSPVLVQGSADEDLFAAEVAGVPATILPGPLFGFSALVNLAPGGNTLAVSASDLACNEAATQAELLLDLEAPTLVLAAPQVVSPGDTLSLSVEASDDVGIAEVSFFVDGVELASDSEPPYQADYPVPSSTPPGVAIAVEARAVDPAGRQTTAAREVAVLGEPASGRGVVAGEVFDDTTGLPIAGATVVLLSLDGSAFDPAPETRSDAAGRYRLPSQAGLARLVVSKPGYTGAERLVPVVGSRRTDPLDARLTPRGAPTPVPSVLGGSLIDGGAQVVIPPGALSQDQSLQLTPLGPQGLVQRAPLGWSALGALDLAPHDTELAAPATASLPAPQGLPGSASVRVARWDADAGVWMAAGLAQRSADGSRLGFPLASAGQWALVVADGGPTAPPVASAGQPLQGLDPAPPPSGVAASVAPAPRVLFAEPGAHSDVAVTASPPAPMPSGTPLRARLDEDFQFLAGAALYPEPRTQDVLVNALSPGGAPADLGAGFAVMPSRPFDPLRLELGVIDVGVSLPDDPYAPRGGIVGGGGGAVAGEDGGSVVVPAGATADEIPVVLTPLAEQDFPAAIPDGLSFLAGATFDLHGAELALPARLSLPAPAAVSPSDRAVAVRLQEVAGTSHLLVVGTASLEGDALALGTDPLGDGSVRFPGLRQGGRCVLLGTDVVLGFVTGVVTDEAGLAVAGALVTADPTSLAATTDAAGRYALALPAGNVSLRVLDPTTGSETTLPVQVVQPEALTPADAQLGPSPPVVVAVSPADGATGVALAARVRVDFSEPLDAASVGPSALLLLRDGAPVAGTQSLAPDRRSLSFRPDALLASDTTYTTEVSAGLRDATGNAVAGPLAFAFTSVDVTPPPRPDVGALEATIPGADGKSSVSGGPGSADPTGEVRIENLATGAVTTTTANSDGSFNVAVDASTSDHLELVLRDAAGNETRLALPAFRNPDGSVVVGSAGGRVEGQGGVFVDVPAGALPDGSVVKVEPLAEAELEIPAPANFPFVGGVKLDLGGVTPREALDLGIPAPAGASADDQIMVARTVQLPTRAAWTIVDRAHLDDGRYVTASPPFVGAMADGAYSFIKPVGDCFSYVAVDFHFRFGFVLVDPLLPFVFPIGVLFGSSTVMPEVCDSEFEIEVRDPETAAVIQRITRRAPAAKDAIAFSEDVLSDDDMPPEIVNANTFAGTQANRLEVRFSEPMDPDSLMPTNPDAPANGFIVTDASGAAVPGTVEVLEGGTLAVFTPRLPFHLGEPHEIVFFGATDRSGNPLQAEPIPFTPFDPLHLRNLGSMPGELLDALRKCTASGGGTSPGSPSPGACTTSVRDVERVGDVLFLANGLLSAAQVYDDPADPQRLLAVDVSDPYAPRLIGREATTTNPRALVAVRNTAFTPAPLVITPPPQGQTQDQDPFAGDLLIVAGGGRVRSGSLNGKLEIYDVTTCPESAGGEPGGMPADCLDASVQLKGEKFLSTAPGIPPRPGVPPEWGIPMQMAALLQKGGPGEDDLVSAYVVLAGLGLEAVQVNEAFNRGSADPELYAPDGLVRGDFVDVAVLKNLVLALGSPGEFTSPDQYRLVAFTPGLSRHPQSDRLPLVPAPPARVSAAENFVVDVDGDGNLGVAEDEDGDDVAALDELFDLAFVSTGSLDQGCPTELSPCGKLYVFDLSPITDLGHTGEPRLVGEIPFQGGTFSVQVDPNAKLAYVEVRDRGLAIVDLSHLDEPLANGLTAPAFVDLDEDGRDDRVLKILPMKQDIFAGEIEVDPRGVAYVNGATSGLDLFQVSENCADLSLDFRPDSDAPLRALQQAATQAPRSRSQQLVDEKVALAAALTRVVEELHQAGFADFHMLEQGSGRCFWRDEFDRDPSRTCGAFRPGRSDHDVEVLVAGGASEVEQAQIVVDAILSGFDDAPPPDYDRLADLSLFAVSQESFDAAELVPGTPLNRSGDTEGDLGLGRQLLMLLWLLEGDYVHIDGVIGPGEPLDDLLEALKVRSPEDQIVPDEPSGVPKLEGYEWALLQEFYFYRSGAMLRIRGACDNLSEVHTARPEPAGNDPVKNFLESGERFGTRNCADELHLVAKAAIRATLARMIAHERGNRVVLDPSLTRDTYLANACRSAVANPLDPPADPAGYGQRGCTSFADYILASAVRVVEEEEQTGVPAEDRIFPDPQTQLPLVYRFYCLKVGEENCRDADGDPSGPILRGDLAVNTFIRDAIRFIQETQARTLEIYTKTRDLDSKLIGDIPFLTAGPPDENGNATPGIAALCEGVGVTLGSGEARALLRQCNEKLAERKLDGDPSVPVDSPTPASIEDDPDRRALIQRKLGVRKLVTLPLRVRAVNRGGQTHPDLLLRLYEGPGTTSTAYQGRKDHHFALDPNARRSIDLGEDGEAIFPLLFNLPELGPPRAAAFFLDPERDVPEQDKENNQADFVYYPLDLDDPSVPPLLPNQAAYAIPNTGADALCFERPRLAFSMSIQGSDDVNTFGDREHAASVFQDVRLTYKLENRGSEPLRNVSVQRDGKVVFSLDELPPGSPIVESELCPAPCQSPPSAQPGTYLLSAQATALDAQGSSVPGTPVTDTVLLTVVESGPFSIELFDDSTLSDPEHPFSRAALHKDDAGATLPVFGAVTDGDEQGGGARLRVEISGLDPARDVTISFEDAELDGVVDGIGRLEQPDGTPVIPLPGAPETAQFTLSSGQVSPDGRLTLHYAPPSRFIREPHRKHDFAAVERAVKLRVAQVGLGTTTTKVRLRRPPVFLVHGLFGNRRIFDDFQPLVPEPTRLLVGVEIPVVTEDAYTNVGVEGGVGPNPYAPVKGFDGRFDVFSLETIFNAEPLAKQSEMLQTQMHLALGSYLEGFAIGKVDAIGFSMGGPNLRRLAQAYTLLTEPADPDSGSKPRRDWKQEWGEVPFRKLISLASPFLGSVVADTIVAVRDGLPQRGELVVDDDDPTLFEDELDPGEGVPPEALENALCAVGISAAGLIPQVSIYEGGVDDLTTYSTELNDILARGIPAPTHALVAVNVTPELGASDQIRLLWATLGSFCNLTPEADTIDATQLAKTKVEIATTILSAGVFAQVELGVGIKEVLRTLEAVKTAKKAAERLGELDVPEPVFVEPNDRVVGEASQLSGFDPGGQTVSFVAGETDHLASRTTPFVTVEDCIDDSDPDNPRITDAIDDFDGLDGRPAITCRAISLLEADPLGPRFEQPTPGDATCPAPVEIQVNATPAQNDDLARTQVAIGDAMLHFATPARVRIASPLDTGMTVVLSSPAGADHGRVVFSGAEDGPWVDVLPFQLPASGEWVDFFIAGEDASQALDDGLIEAHFATMSGEVCGEEDLTAFTISARITAQVGGDYTLIPHVGYQPNTPSAIDFTATATLEPPGVDCAAPPLADLHIGLVQNVVRTHRVSEYQDPFVEFDPGQPSGATAEARSTLRRETTLSKVTTDSSDPTPQEPSLRPPLFTPDVVRPAPCPGAQPLLHSDFPSTRAPFDRVPGIDDPIPAQDPQGNEVGTVEWENLVHATYEDRFRTYVISFEGQDANEQTIVETAVPLRQINWMLVLDSGLNGQRAEIDPAGDGPPADAPVLARPFTNDAANAAQIIEFSDETTIITNP